ncbi:MAG: Unknown protein [uncultured Aureispira sp.]|uniref:Uncharacterized protein n=1 Tax=uncultured Aureispira sp. TaxID=1331704 RepID=A0A6S6UJK0_9BACT|nr:MAG: Unknown protein [uncultured Aureispira sp.]
MIGSNSLVRDSEAASRTTEVSKKEEILNYDDGTYCMF